MHAKGNFCVSVLWLQCLSIKKVFFCVSFCFVFVFLLIRLYTFDSFHRWSQFGCEFDFDFFLLLSELTQYSTGTGFNACADRTAYIHEYQGLWIEYSSSGDLNGWSVIITWLESGKLLLTGFIVDMCPHVRNVHRQKSKIRNAKNIYISYTHMCLFVCLFVCFVAQWVKWYPKKQKRIMDSP